MEVLHARCAGLDVHKDTVVACVRLATGDEVQQEVRSFSTTTQGLLALADWLLASGVTHAAMEATGVYWKPVWHVLESACELVLANSAHVRNVPGRKTDVNDAVWIADLLAHGLVRASFVPPTPVLELRDLTRTRKQLVREISQHTLRIQRVLEDANLKITGLISDLLGLSGRAILDAIANGETDPERLVALTDRRLKPKRPALLQALQGHVAEHHRFLIRLHLGQIDALQRAVAEIESRLGEALIPFRWATRLLTTMPGVSDVVAQVLVAEIGVEMGRFPTAGHLVSWAGLCPRMDQSAGKRRSTRVRHGAPWLKTVLVQAAWAGSRKRDSYLRAQFLRLKGRRGAKKAIVAVAASMLTSAFYMLRDGVGYQDLGPDHFDRRDRTRIANRLVRRLEELGLKVQIEAAA
jgi:transposase